jgi:small subunit ribosomal protein S3
MGRKVNPIGFRLKINRDWDAHWFAEGRRYTELLHEDFKLRQYIYKGSYLSKKDGKGDNPQRQKEAPNAALSRIEIERYANVVTVTIHTAKPGVLIGHKGETVKKLRQELKSLTGKEVKVEVEEIAKPDLDAKLVADTIVSQLERRIGHSRAMKRAISQAMRQGALGIKIQVSGRLGGSEMSRREWQTEGRVPRSTLRSLIDYAASEALTTYGRLGVKVWIYTGMKAHEDIPELTADAYVSQ